MARPFLIRNFEFLYSPCKYFQYNTYRVEKVELSCKTFLATTNHIYVLHSKLLLLFFNKFRFYLGLVFATVTYK